MTKILARKKNGKKCQSVTGFKNVEGVLSKHLNRGFQKLQKLTIFGFYFEWSDEDASEASIRVAFPSEARKSGA